MARSSHKVGIAWELEDNKERVFSEEMHQARQQVAHKEGSKAIR